LEFQAAFAEEIAPSAHGNHAPAVADKKNLSARLVSCRDGRARVMDTLGPKEGDLIYFGTYASLDRPGHCWEVHAKVSVWSDIVGFMDPTMGSLLFAWFVPEG